MHATKIVTDGQAPVPERLTELAGVSWCTEHGAVWWEGDVRCTRALYQSVTDCVEAAVFIAVPEPGAGST